MAFKIIDLLVIEEYLLAIEILKTTGSGEFSGDYHNKTILQA